MELTTLSRLMQGQTMSVRNCRSHSCYMAAGALTLTGPLGLER